MLWTYEGEAQNNSFSFVYAPAFTKLDIKDFPGPYLGEWNAYGRSKKNDVPIYGFNVGVEYKRTIKKLKLGVGFFYAELGQQSGIFYQLYGIYEYSKRYGGANYVMTYRGAEIPICVEYLIKKRGNFNFSLNSGASLNFMEEFEVRNYFVDGITGIYKESGTYQRHQSIENGFFYNISHAPLEMIRIAASFGFEAEYCLHKNLSVSIAPTLKYYSNSLKKTNNSTMLDADAFLLGAKMNFNIKF